MEGRRSPAIARILSIIPGLGHIYAGAYPTGIIWLVIGQAILSLLYIKHTNIKIAGTDNLYIISAYILMVVWCMIQSSRFAAERNAQKASQAFFESRKYADDQKRVEEMKKMLGEK
ncbi:MAG: hypothetical protein ACE14V_04845 [bacterium]